MIGDRKTENAFTLIKDATETAQNIKSTQPISGKSFVTYVTESGLQFDYSVTIPQSYKTAVIDFTYSPGAEFKQHILKPSVYYRLNDPNVMASPIVDSYNLFTDITVFQTRTGQGFGQWIVQMTNANASSQTFYLKVYFYGTTSGTFTVTAP